MHVHTINIKTVNKIKTHQGNINQNKKREAVILSYLGNISDSIKLPRFISCGRNDVAPRRSCVEPPVKQAPRGPITGLGRPYPQHTRFILRSLDHVILHVVWRARSFGNGIGTLPNSFLPLRLWEWEWKSGWCGGCTKNGFFFCYLIIKGFYLLQFFVEAELLSFWGYDSHIMKFEHKIFMI